MTSSGPAHPLDVELADRVDGRLDEARAAEVEAHLAGCLLCRVKCQRLRSAVPVVLASEPWTGTGLPSLPFAVPAPHDRRDASAGELWLAAGPGPEDDRLLVWIVRVLGDRVAVAPVTFDTEAADDETVVIGADRSPLGLGLALYPALAVEVPSSLLVSCMGEVSLDGGRAGAPITGPADPRLDVRQLLADRLGALEDRPPDPGSARDAPPPTLDDVRSELVRDVRAWRGDACSVRSFSGWADIVAAHRMGWEPVAVLDEIGIVVVVLDTPRGLTDDQELDAARSVLTRMNATALVVLARAISGTAEVYDAPALNYGIEAPSGQRTPPRPLIAGLAAVDAIAKFLDQSTGARAMSLPERGSIGRVDVGEVLREAAATAVADAMKQGTRFKIAPKRRGYESLADAADGVAAVLGRALAGEPVAGELVELARRPVAE